jgi:predicted secreted Zn-dependent protease
MRSAFVACLASLPFAAMAAPAAAQTPAAPAGQAPVPAPDPFEGIPNVEISHYDVTGDTLQRVRASMKAIRPTDPQTGERLDALTRWSMRWGWPTDSLGGCDLANAHVEFSGSVTMPRLTTTPETPESVLITWDRFMTALRAYEGGRLRQAYDRAGDVLAAIKASDCATAPAAAQRAFEQVVQLNARYNEEHPYGFAWPGEALTPRRRFRPG